MNKLFRSIDILDDKSLTVLMDNTRSNLWILRHFKDLTITYKNICYQVNNGYRQTKNPRGKIGEIRKISCCNGLEVAELKEETLLNAGL